MMPPFLTCSSSLPARYRHDHFECKHCGLVWNDRCFPVWRGSNSLRGSVRLEEQYNIRKQRIVRAWWRIVRLEEIATANVTKPDMDGLGLSEKTMLDREYTFAIKRKTAAERELATQKAIKSTAYSEMADISSRMTLRSPWIGNPYHCIPERGHSHEMVVVLRNESQSHGAHTPSRAD